MIGVPGGQPRHARIDLPGNRSLMASVSAAMATLGWPSATLMIQGGPMSRAVFTCSVITPNGPRWIDYGPRRDVGPCWLAMGNATFGRAMDNTDALHCHGVLSNEQAEAQGGHLVPEECHLAEQGLTAHAFGATAAAFHVTADKSGFNLLSPQ